MRKIIIISSMSLMLASCTMRDEAGELQVPPEAYLIQTRVAQFCDFKITLQSVIDIMNAANPIVQGVDNIVNAVCMAVATKPFTAWSDIYTEETCPKVNDVCIDGERIVVPEGDK